MIRCAHCGGSHESAAEVRTCWEKSNRASSAPRSPGVSRGASANKRSSRKSNRRDARDGGGKTPPGPWSRRRAISREAGTRESSKDERDYTLNIPLRGRAARERIEAEKARVDRLQPRGPAGHVLYIAQGPDNAHRGSPTHIQTWVGNCECGWSRRGGSVDALWALHANHCASLGSGL